MYFSLTFTNDNNESKNTWDDWGLIPLSRPLVNPPAVKTEYVDVPGADGSLDYTEALTGEVKFGNREGQWDFAVDTKYNVLGENMWDDTYRQIVNFLHGRHMKSVKLESMTALNVHFKGRLSVDEWASSKGYSTVTIRYVLEPEEYLDSEDSEEDGGEDPSGG